MSRVACLTFFTFLAVGTAVPAAEPPAPFGPLPSERQLRWHEMEYYGFIHFTVKRRTVDEFTNQS